MEKESQTIFEKNVIEFVTVAAEFCAFLERAEHKMCIRDSNAIMAPMPYAYLDFYQEDPEIAPTTIGGYTTLKKTYSYNPVPDLSLIHILSADVWQNR